MKRYLLTAFMIFNTVILFPQTANDFIDNDINHESEIQEDRLEQYTEAQIENASNNSEIVQGEANAINEGLGHLNTLMDIARSAQDLYEASRGLSAGECAPDFSTNSAALMSSDCKEGDACWDCYGRAINELDFVRRQLGRLNCIYQNTKNFTNSAIAFGDNASGIHAVTGLSWQSARSEIVASYNHFKQTYDKKYTDMIGALDRALHAIDQCETQFGDGGWYRTSGFIYFEFMKERYKRTD